MRYECFSAKTDVRQFHEKWQRTYWKRPQMYLVNMERIKALKCYQLAVAHSEYRAGENWTRIVAEALALTAYLGNAKPFLKQLKHRAIALGLIAQPKINDDVVEDWEIEELRKQFHHLFPGQGRFGEVEQPDDDVGALPFLMYDPESLANR